MSTIERQVKKAQHRLWMNRWLRLWGWSLLIISAAWTIGWLIDRLFFPGQVPKDWAAAIGLAISLVVSIIWLVVTREPAQSAAAALDEAAGLRERVATGLHVQNASENPFARAVVADAERAVAGLTARRFIPIRWARSLSFSSVMIVVALLSLLLPEFDLLGKGQAKADQHDRLARLAKENRIIAKPISIMKQIEKKHPDLSIKDAARRFDNPLDRRDETDPDVLRRETVKKLDRLQDALKQKAGADRFKALNETKKRLKQLGEPSDPQSDICRLLDALSDGDFQEAQEAVKQMREKLAKRSADGDVDAETAKEMQKQLNEMAEKLEQAAKDKQSQRELQNTGMSKAEAKRVLEALAKKDPEQVAKAVKELAQRLKDKGMSEEQAKQMAKKIQQRQQACKQCQKLGQKMGNAAKELDKGNTKGAQQQMGEAGDMLNDMEQLEQALNELESQMGELDDTRDDLNDDDSEQDDGKCKHCNGTGFLPDGSRCPHCGGTGRRGGMKGAGGAQDRDDSAQTGTTDKKAKVKTRKNGAIIGQRFVKGSMLKGKSQVELYDAAAAAEIDAADALNKDRIPRRYRSAVKKYFDRLKEDVGKSPSPDDKDTGDTDTGGTGAADDADNDDKSSDAPKEPEK